MVALITNLDVITKLTNIFEDWGDSLTEVQGNLGKGVLIEIGGLLDDSLVSILDVLHAIGLGVSGGISDEVSNLVLIDHDSELGRWLFGVIIIGGVISDSLISGGVIIGGGGGIISCCGGVVCWGG